MYNRLHNLSIVAGGVPLLGLGSVTCWWRVGGNIISYSIVFPLFFCCTMHMFSCRLAIDKMATGAFPSGCLCVSCFSDVLGSQWVRYILIESDIKYTMSFETSHKCSPSYRDKYVSALAIFCCVSNKPKRSIMVQPYKLVFVHFFISSQNSMKLLVGTGQKKAGTCLAEGLLFPGKI